MADIISDIFHPTASLRYVERTQYEYTSAGTRVPVSSERVLQQAWQGVKTGATKWIDVPTETESEATS